MANYNFIKEAYLELLAASPRSYPEVSAEALMSTILSLQTEQDQAELPRARIEVAFIRTTRADEGRGLKGTLCRGELMELLLRLTWAPHDVKAKNYPIAQHV